MSNGAATGSAGCAPVVTDSAAIAAATMSGHPARRVRVSVPLTPCFTIADSSRQTDIPGSQAEGLRARPGHQIVLSEEG
jgi:hypothetical protein